MVCDIFSMYFYFRVRQDVPVCICSFFTKKTVVTSVVYPGMAGICLNFRFGEVKSAKDWTMKPYFLVLERIPNSEVDHISFVIC